MEGKTVYRLEIDGVMYYEEYKTPDKALEGARMYFAKDHSLQHADVLKYIVLPIGLGINNKDYEDEFSDN